MAKMYGRSDFDHGRVPSTGVLLVNVGSPDAPTAQALRRYLKQFLSDPRVIEDQGLTWKLVLNGIILRTRPARSAQAYRTIWTEEGSPLLAVTKRQAEGLEARLRQRAGSPVHVAWGMGYGSPSVVEALRQLEAGGCDRILILPMYPQYAAATVGSAFDAVTTELQRWRWVPQTRFITHYHDDAAYIEALAASIRDHQTEHGRPDRLLLSFHGLPRRCLQQGDPYHCQCCKTARLLWDCLQLPEGDRHLAFQSRFGREVWLQPYTDETLKAWGAAGLGRVDVICPGFSADCLETLEEIGDENRGLFLEAGGRDLRYIRALNDRADHLDALAGIVWRHLGGWVTASEAWDPAAAGADADARAKRAEQEKKRGLNG